MTQLVDQREVQTSVSQSALTPDTALQMLQAGNERFVQRRMIQRDLPSQVAQTGGGQYPLAAILGCIDSRVPAELVFDQGIGDIFNVRIAGNFVNTDILGSLEFACKVAGSKVILVLGHSSCGAVKGACDGVKLGNLTEMLGRLQPAVDAVTDVTEDRTSANAAFVQKVSDKNVELTVAAIREQSPILREMESAGQIAIVGGMYDVKTGKVTLK